MIFRRFFLSALFLIVPCSANSLAGETARLKGMAGSKPNIILILVDDMGWGEVNAFWEHPELNGRTVPREHSFKTPTLDRMAAEGMQLRRHYTTSPVCAPARAGLMLGVHMGHSRVLRNKCFDDPIENSHTLATVLKGAGYETAAVGKWGIGGGGESAGGKPGYHYSMSATPDQRGFDYFYGVVDHLSGHFHYLGENMKIAKNPDLGKVWEYNHLDDAPRLRNVRSTVPDTAYDTDMFAARAKKWIMDHHARTPSQPFFLYLAFPAPHANSVVPACAYPPGLGVHGGLQWVEKDGLATSNTGTKALAEAAGVKGKYEKDSYIHPDNAAPCIDQEVERRHATMIRRVDDTIADMIQTLKELGIDDNTMIVFTSDNGPHHEGGADSKHWHGAKNPAYFRAYGMMDGIKKDTWEGGMREPTLVRWPKYINKGGISLNASQFQDWMATFAEAAGVPVPARCDGVSLLPTLAGVPERQKKSNIYVEYFGDLVTTDFQDFLPAHRNVKGDTDMQQVVYVDGLKGVRRQGGGNNDDRKLNPEKDFMIFDTKKDPQEAKNLASSRPDLQEKMKARVLRMRRSSAPQSVQGLDAACVPSLSPCPSGLKPGLAWRVWNRSFDWVPDFSQMGSPDAAGHTAGVNVQVTPSLARKGVELSGYLTVPKDGEYTFYLNTDAGEGSKAFVHLHDMQLIDADFNYIPGEEADSRAVQGVAEDVLAKIGPAALAAQTVKLKAGLHPIRIGYVGKTPSSSLSLKWENAAAGLKKQDIPAEAFSCISSNPAARH
ncbi:sulfatase-like hydrolase/transferase [Akkermansia sp.]|uniref:sulfatase-like hydrolase/transferase n=1 Tax=Akkermansia sp. TaxID=1872421 RepID=UPI0025BAFC52|nr:sulfatase-like hydrolase/transferase [Akkermansia sp.]MCC8147857.1 sulfatase-like hydrolase/transferase [Akkermansia sp.]